jgi:hypothetical protein
MDTLIEGVDALDQHLGEAALVDRNARARSATALDRSPRGRLSVDEGVEPCAVENAPTRKGGIAPASQSLAGWDAAHSSRDDVDLSRYR